MDIMQKSVTFFPTLELKYISLKTTLIKGTRGLVGKKKIMHPQKKNALKPLGGDNGSRKGGGRQKGGRGESSNILKFVLVLLSPSAE